MPHGSANATWEALQPRPLFQSKDARERLAFREDVRTSMRAVGDDRNDGHAGLTRHVDEAGARKDDHLVASLEVTVGVEVAARIDQHLAASLENPPRVGARRTHAPQPLQAVAPNGVSCRIAKSCASA